MAFTANRGSSTDRCLILRVYSPGGTDRFKSPSVTFDLKYALCKPYASSHPHLCVIHVHFVFGRPFSHPFITCSEWPTEKKKEKKMWKTLNWGGGSRSTFSSCFFIFIPRGARSSLFALWTFCFSTGVEWSDTVCRVTHPVRHSAALDTSWCTERSTGDGRSEQQESGVVRSTCFTCESKCF